MRIKRLVIGIFNMASSLNLKTHYNAIPISYNQKKSKLTHFFLRGQKQNFLQPKYSEQNMGFGIYT